MKLRSILLALCLAGTGLSAAGRSQHNQAFHKGAFYLGGALGLSSGFGPLGGITFIGNAEYAVTNDIGIGGSIGYWGYSEEINSAGYTIKYKYSIIPIIVSGAYHFHLGNPKLDLAAGLSLGYYIASSSVETSSSGLAYGSATASGIALGIFGLVRYFVADHVALRGKLGYGITFIEVGVDFRF